MGQTVRVVAFLATCFGVGALVMPGSAQAWARDCIGPGFWKVDNPTIEGDGDQAAQAREAEFWEDEMWVNNVDGVQARLEFNTNSAAVELRRVQ